MSRTPSPGVAPPASLVGPALGLLVALLGLSTTIGWLLHVPAMVEIRHGLVPMVFNTGLSFLLAGVAIALPVWRHRWAVRARTFMASLLMGLCGITLLEFFLDRSLFGIDLAGLHSWHDYGNTRPGRMAPNTALGFLVAAGAILMSDRVSSRRRGIVEVTLTFLLLAIGLTGFVGYLLAPELLFNWARSARMALHTAGGMILMALALWLSWSRSAWYLGETYFREDAKVRLLSGAILIIVTTTATFGGFVFQQQTVRSSLDDRLTDAVRVRKAWLHLFTKDLVEHAGEVADLSGLDTVARTLSAGEPMTRSARAELDRLANVFARQGWHRVTIQAHGGDSIAVTGPAHTNPAFDVPLDERRSVELLWDGDLVLRINRTLTRGSPADPARVTMERPVPELASALFSVVELGESGEVAACTMHDSTLLCLPTRSRPKPFAAELRPSSAPLPMQRALAGGSGVVQGIDHRQQNVLAAYGQLAPGLGFVAQQDAAEAYAPIRHQLGIVTGLMLLVSVTGAWLMIWQLSPLVARMRGAEAVASDTAVKMQTIVESAGDGIVTVAADGTIESANTAAHLIFGYEPGQLLGQPFARLISAQPHVEERVGQAPDGKTRHPDVPLPEGQRRDGSRFPLEWTFNSAPLLGQEVSVMILRDISRRQELENELARLAQYDQLTGLPNRALFLDRLATAALRASRSRRALAVMFLDLDGFKAINDGFGHREGDAVLVETAKRLSSVLRKSDTIARLGGDEFTIVLEQLTNFLEDVSVIAGKIVQAMQVPFIVQGQACQVTVSIGVAVHPDDQSGMSATVLLNQADDAMYEAKRAGKNAFRVTVVSASAAEA